MGLYYEPKGISPILQESARVQVPLLSQPSGLSQALPALGGVAEKGFQRFSSIQQAKRDYENFLTLTPEEQSIPGNYEHGANAAAALGLPRPNQRAEVADPRLMAYYQGKAGIPGAAIRGTKANIGLAENIAKLEKPPAPKFGELTQSQQEAIDKAMSDGRLAPAQITRGPKLVALANQFMKNPLYDASAADIKFAGGKTESGAAGRVRGGKGTEVASAVGSLHDTIGFARPYVMKLNKSDIPAVNEAFQKGLAAIEGNPDATALLVHMNEMRGQYAQIIHGGGTPTDQDYQEATKVLRGGLNPAGFDSMSEAVVKAGRSRAGRLTGRISNEDVFSPSPKHASGGGNDLQDAINAL